jgi:hypothetical protein
MAMAWLSTACWTCRHAAHLGTIGIVLSEHEGVLPRGRELIVRSCPDHHRAAHRHQWPGARLAVLPPRFARNAMPATEHRSSAALSLLAVGLPGYETIYLSARAGDLAHGGGSRSDHLHCRRHRLKGSSTTRWVAAGKPPNARGGQCCLSIPGLAGGRLHAMRSLSWRASRISRLWSWSRARVWEGSLEQR